MVSWLLPRGWRTSNREPLPLRGELEALLPSLPDVSVPVTVIHGGKDRLVPPANADFAARVLVNAPVTLERHPELDHFLVWTRRDVVFDAVLRTLADI